MADTADVDGAARGQLATLARLVAGAVPPLVEQLAGAHPQRVYREAMAVLERPLLLHALTLTGGNQLRAARLLGLNRNTLRKRCRDLGLRTVGLGGHGRAPQPPPRAAAPARLDNA